MATVTAQALIAAGLRRADMRDSPTAFIKHPAAGGGEAFDYLNAAIAALYDILFESESEDYKPLSSVNSTANGTAIYSWIPSTAYRLTKIDYTLDPVSGSGPAFNARWTPLVRVNLAEMSRYGLNGRPNGYHLDGDGLTIFPTPDGIYSIRTLWELLPPECSADADVVDLKGPWKEFVWKHIAVACLGKQESDTLELRQDLYGPNLDGNGGLSQRIRTAAKKHDTAGPLAPVDVMGDGAGDLPPFARWTG